MTSTIGSELTLARQRLAGVHQPGLEAEILLAHCLDSSRSFLYANPELALPDARIRNFNELLQSRLAGTPIAYLTQRQEFWSLPLEVTPDTLIPRPETELLVEAALAAIPAGSNFRIADMGTGSGAVALAIASERPDASLVAVDISEAALTVAQNNAACLDISNVEFIRSDWFKSLSGRFDVVVSNPPYIASGDQHLSQGDLRFEPRESLVAGPDGLDAIRQISARCAQFLEEDGLILLEHGFEQGTAVRALLSEAGYEGINTLKDLELRERVTVAQRTAQPGD